MPMEIKPRDLLAAGWSENPRLGAAVKRARELEAAGYPRDAVWAQLETEFPKVEQRTELRTSSAPLAEAIVAESTIEQVNVAAARQRMLELLQVPVVQRGALMPDACPAGPMRATIPVGGAIAVENAILPGAHSADICCSVWATLFVANQPLGDLMDHLERATHFGAGGRPRGQQWPSAVVDEPVWNNVFLSGLRSRAQEFLGTQGDGNHFAYLGQLQFTEAQVATLAAAGYTTLAETATRRDGQFDVLVTHHGSRGLGADVYKRGLAAASAWCRAHTRGIPDAAVWLPADSEPGQAFWAALQYVGRWTRENHALIHEAFLKRVGVRALAQFGNEHNFVWRREDGVFLHGKGATPAWRDADGRPLLGLIPLNMAREILIVLGGDQAEYLSFCPHGAGRNQSRRAMLAPYRDAEGELDPEKVRQVLAEATPGLDVRWYQGAPDLSESPLGYKDAAKVKAQIETFRLATVVGEITPRGCIMAGEAPEPHWARARREKRAAHKKARREGEAELR